MKFEEFTKRYRKELKDSDAFEELLQEVRSHERVVLLYGAKDEQHNQAVVLAELLGERL